MRSRGMVVLSVLIAAAAAALAAEPAKGLALGDKIPAADVKMKGVDGQEVAIADIAGAKGTLVVFTCNACPWVKAWQGRIGELGNAYRDRGLGVIEINPNDPGKVAEDGYAQMQERAAAVGMKYPYVVDATSAVARAFGATRTPEAFLFDGQGRLVYHGTIDDNAREPQSVEKRWLKDALEALAGGGEVQVKETKALGCTIKFRGQA